MDKFCKFCGTKHTALEYPKKCDNCNRETFINPTPVAVLLQPVQCLKTNRIGLLIGERCGPFDKPGSLALIGGYVDMVDASVAHAAARELKEETSLEIETETIKIVDSSNNGRVMLMACSSNHILDLKHVEENFKASSEISRFDVIYEPMELCFPTHTLFAKKWFETGYH